jgi:glycosyltransferase involved in cell wall biosynthesis
MPLLTSLALSAQRFKFPLPQVVRDPLRRLLHGMVEDKLVGHGVEGWTTPLIARCSDLVVPLSPGLEERINVDTLPANLNRPAAADATLRCLVVTSDLDAGGMDEVAALLARRLNQHRIATAVLHASAHGTEDGKPSGRLGRILASEGIEVVELAHERGLSWIASWNPDIISAHGAPEWVMNAAAQFSVPLVETLHGMHSLFNANWENEVRRSEKIQCIVAVSELVRQQYLRNNPSFPREKILTIPNGVDLESRTPVDRAAARARLGLQDEFMFISLSRHCLQKNTYGLVAAFEEVAARHPKAHLVIAGRPDDAVYFSQVRRLRDGLKCRDRIHLRDHTPKPAELLSAADGFVLDSFFEGWSLASMEALCAGVPIVVSDVGGAREQLADDERRGFLIPNPVGDALAVNWNVIRDFSFRRQANREPLVHAMSSLVQRQAEALARRAWLIEDSKVRFNIDRCLQSHAGVLKAAAKCRALQSRP